ncbi:MAG: ABC transporter permease [Acidimicrobiia bacterium]
MREALSVEFLKLRKSPVALITGMLIVLLIPAMSFGLVSVVEGSGSGLLAEKVRVLVTGTGWVALGGLLNQFAASAVFVGVSVVAVWCFGREFSDRTVGSLFALPTSRGTIAGAKLIVILCWSLLVSVLLVTVAAAIGVLGGLGRLDSTAFEELGTVILVAWLTSLLASTLSLPASIGRGYLPAIGVMVLILMTAQMAVLFEAGAWYPYASPGLWAVSSDQGDLVVGVAHLATVPVLAGVSSLLTVRWWQRFELV